MASAVNYRRTAEGLAAVAVSALLSYFGNGMEPRWPLMWFAPLPLLLFALRATWWSTTIVVVASVMLGNLSMWSYMTKTLGMPASAWAEIFLAGSVAFAAAVLLFRALVLRGAVWSGLAAFPAVWVTCEFARYLGTPHGSAASFAYSQLRFLPFLQFASITGPWGMTFVLLLLPAAVAIAVHLLRKDSRGAKRSATQVACAGAGVVAAILLFGALRLASPSGQTVKVGLIASDEKANIDVADSGADAERLYSDYARTAQMLAARGAQAIVMPEKIGVTIQGKNAATDAMLQSVSDQAGVVVVAGALQVDAPVKFNEARIYTPGAAVQRYDKQHMLPPFESNLKPGTALVELSRPNQKWGVAICKDMDFASPARDYGLSGAGLMLVPAWDFVVDAGWHGHIAIMRGVEDGFSVVRAAKGGFLTVSDSRGRILGEVRSGSAPFATLLVDVPATHSWTVYQRMGNWFAWTCVGIVVFTAVRLLWIVLRSRFRFPAGGQTRP